MTTTRMQAVQQVTGVDDTINPFVASLKPSKTMALTGAGWILNAWARRQYSTRRREAEAGGREGIEAGKSGGGE